jgi:hypothetical protein
MSTCHLAVRAITPGTAIGDAERLVMTLYSAFFGKAADPGRRNSRARGAGPDLAQEQRASSVPDGGLFCGRKVSNDIAPVDFAVFQREFGLATAE